MSKNGQSCTDAGGVMDYVDQQTKWSDCSHDNLFDVYSKDSESGPYCLETTCSEYNLSPLSRTYFNIQGFRNRRYFW